DSARRPLGRLQIRRSLAEVHVGEAHHQFRLTPGRFEAIRARPHFRNYFQSTSVALAHLVDAAPAIRRCIPQNWSHYPTEPGIVWLGRFGFLNKWRHLGE